MGKAMNQIQPSTTARKAWTIEEFCAAHGICRATYYNLKKAGKAPPVMKVGGRKQLISEEAATEWRAAMTAAA
jgi:predicted DNA-binding transcriptional regulator AlpA